MVARTRLVADEGIESTARRGVPFLSRALTVTGILASVLVVGTMTSAAGPADPAPASAKGTLELRLLASRARYELAEGGQGLRQQIAAVRSAEAAVFDAGRPKPGIDPATGKFSTTRAGYPRDAEPQPAPPALEVDLTLELTNRSSGPLEVLGDEDDRVELKLALRGPGVEILPTQRMTTLEVRTAEPFRLAPGETHKIHVSHLSYGHRGDAFRAYWTRPGKYTLEAWLRTGVKPAPRGTKADADGFATVAAKSNPVSIEVASRAAPSKTAPP